jgi:hypothetical protein
MTEKCPKCRSTDLIKGQSNLWCNSCGYFPIEKLDILQSELDQLKAENRVLHRILDTINEIMWNSYMIKSFPFNRDHGFQIMEQLEKWAKL